MSHRNVPEVRVLEILWERSDAEHPLRQKEIADIYRSRFQEDLSPKVLRNLLRELADELESVNYKSLPNEAAGNAEMRSDFYLEHDFTDEELRFLIDAVTFATHMPPGFQKEIVRKLINLSSAHFRPRHVLAPPADECANPELFMTIGALDEAIRRNLKVEHKYLEYDIHCRLNVRKTKDGSERVHVISPYQFAQNEGKYYIVCNNERFDTLAHYRVDRMTSAKVLEGRPRRPLTELGFMATELDLDAEMRKYCHQHIYMFGGDSTNAKLRVARRLVNPIVDAFGSNVSFREEGRNLYAFVRVDTQAIIRFVKSYAPDIEVVAPEDLRRAIAKDLRDALASLAPATTDSR